MDSTTTAIPDATLELSTARPRALSTRWRDRAVRLASVFIVLVSWEVYGRSVNPILFTYPTAVAQAAVTIIASGEMWKYLSASLGVFAVGLALAIVVGIPLGVLMARY